MSARERILTAVAEIMTEEGSDHLTVDRIAARARLSKGGVFYHFKSKDEMLQAMLAGLLDEFDADIARFQNQGLSYGAAIIEASFAKPAKDGRMVAGIMAAASVDRDLALVLSSHREHWCLNLSEAGVATADAEVLISALDGLLIREALGLGPVGSQREALRERMYRLLCPTEQEMLASMFTNALASVA